MADAPERIWVRKHPTRHKHHWHDATSSLDVAETSNGMIGTINPFVEYIRADLARHDDTLVAAAVKAERDRIVEGLRYEAEVSPCEEDATVMKGCADLICAGFSYEAAEKMKEARPAPTLAEALALPEIAALVEAARDARFILAEHEPHPLPVLGRLLAALARITGEAKG